MTKKLPKGKLRKVSAKARRASAKALGSLGGRAKRHK
jgi:hypothetical protein